MVVPVGPAERRQRVRVHPALSAEDRAGHQGPPGTAAFVVHVVQRVAPPRPAFAVSEDEFPLRPVQEHRIRHPLFLPPRHPVHRLQRVDVERPGGAEVDQRHIVHVAAQVQQVAAVQSEHERIVRIPLDVARQLLEPPRGLSQPPLRDRHLPLRIVERDELRLAPRQQREIDRMPGPGRREVDRTMVSGRGGPGGGEHLAKHQPREQHPFPAAME